MTESPLVSVVIPAYNAEATLDETLQSVRTQTHRALEIIVVDDGSTDATPRVAARHAAADARVRVLRQENAGVAAARNRGWQAAASDLIAFVDADDLWAPTKIERQLKALQTGGQTVGLVYCWAVKIYHQSEMAGALNGVRWEGHVFDRLIAGNFIGNGSSALVRRQALIDANGFDGRLRLAGAEGCEDRLFYCRVAEKYDFAVVPEHLLGYRYLPGNMSSNRTRMLQSWLLVDDQLLERHPRHARTLKRGLRDYGVRLVLDALKNDVRQIPPMLQVMFDRSPSIAANMLLMAAAISVLERVRALQRRFGRTATSQADTPSRRFPIGDLDS